MSEIRSGAAVVIVGSGHAGGRAAEALRLGGHNGIDRDASAVELDDATRVKYQFLILTTGTRPRPLVLEGADHPLVCYLRTLGDSQRLQRRLKPGARIVIIGAGFIGMEVAATAVSSGCAVTSLELAERPMARGVPPLLGSYYADLHRHKGVDLRTATRVLRITAAGARALVHIDNDEVICRGTPGAVDVLELTGGQR